MNYLNITNIHDNSLAQFKVGLVKATMFKVKNTGSAIEITDDANSVSKLKVGGSAGFTISLVGGKIVFSANSGASPLRIIEPNVGGVPSCPYLYTHQDKYSGAAATSLDNSEGTPVMFSAANTDISLIHRDTALPSANNVPEGSLLMASGGEWIPVNMDDLVSEITKNVVSQLKTNEN